MYACVFAFNCTALMSTTFLNRECLQADWLPRSNLSWSCTRLLSLLSSNMKGACQSQGGQTRPNRGAINGCRLWVCSKTYSASSYKRSMCVVFWREVKRCYPCMQWLAKATEASRQFLLPNEKDHDRKRSQLQRLSSAIWLPEGHMNSTRSHLL